MVRLKKSCSRQLKITAVILFMSFVLFTSVPVECTPAKKKVFSRPKICAINKY